MILEIILVFLGIIFISIYTIFQIKTRKQIQKLPITPNMPIVENDYRKEFTDGYTLGTLKQMIPRKNGTSFIEFYPIDVEQGEDIPKPPVQSLIVKNEFIKTFSRGDLSSRRERIKLITRDPSMIPDKMRDTFEGEWITKEGQKAWILSTFRKGLIENGDEAIAEAMKEYARGNISKSAMAEIRATNTQLRKLQLQQEEKEKKE